MCHDLLPRHLAATHARSRGGSGREPEGRSLNAPTPRERAYIAGISTLYAAATAAGDHRGRALTTLRPPQRLAADFPANLERPSSALEALATSGEERERLKGMAPKPAIDFSQLSFTKRLQLVEDLWDSLEAEQDAIPIPDWHLEELDRRLEAYREKPDAGASWEEVRERILKREA